MNRHSFLVAEISEKRLLLEMFLGKGAEQASNLQPLYLPGFSHLPDPDPGKEWGTVAAPLLHSQVGSGEAGKDSPYFPRPQTPWSGNLSPTPLPSCIPVQKGSRTVGQSPQSFTLLPQGEPSKPCRVLNCWAAYVTFKADTAGNWGRESFS